MIHVWVLMVISCSGPGATGDCRPPPAEVPIRYATRGECHPEAVRREMMNERVRAWCLRTTTKE